MRCLRSVTMVMALSLICAAAAPAVLAAPEFVNGLALDGARLDRSGGTDANTGRVGYFSDIYYDPARGHWWGLSDRGPGGGALHYETRVQRFRLKIDRATGAISGFKILKTVIFKDESGDPLDGIAPNPTDVLGNAFDPEGFVVHPKTGHFLVSDEYGPSLYEFNRRRHSGADLHHPGQPDPTQMRPIRRIMPATTGNTAGKRTNRGFEGLAISPDGAYAYAMLQSAMLDEGGGDGVCNRIVKFDTETGDSRRPVRLPDGGLQPGPRHLRPARGQRSRVPGPRTQQPGHRRGAEILASRTRRSSASTSTARPMSAMLPSRPAPVLWARSPRPAPSSTSPPTPCPHSATRCRRSGRAWPSAHASRAASYLLLAGTDNDYSVTQNAGGEQFDVYFRFTDADPYASSIQCPLGTTTGCFFT